jgi:Fe-S cluster biogenesis protein NfuA
MVSLNLELMLSGYKEITSMKEKVEEILGMVRPMLQRDGGDVELVSVDEDGTVQVKLKGACDGCAMASMTLKMGIEKILKQEIPGVKEVVAVD